MTNATRRTLAPLVLLVGVTACASLPKETHWAPVKAVHSGGDPTVAGAEGYYAAAVSAINRRDYAMALDLLQEADAHKPGDVRVNNAIGVVYDKLGRFDLSARYYALAQAADAGSAVVAGNMAYSATLQGRALAATAALTPLATREAPPAEPKPSLPPRASVRLAALAPGQQLLTAPAAAAMSAPAAVALTPLATRQAPAPAPKPGLPALASVRLAALTPAQQLVNTPAAAAMPAPPAAEPLAPLPLHEAPRQAAVTPAKPGVFERAVIQLGRLASGQPLLRPPTAMASAGAPIVLAAAAPNVVRWDGVADTRAPRRLPLLAGRGLEIADASGLRGGADAVRLELTHRGWSAQAPHPAVVAARSSIYYPPAKIAIAQGLARTLPFKVQLAACADCRAIRLTIGRDSLRWTTRARSPQSRRL